MESKMDLDLKSKHQKNMLLSFSHSYYAVIGFFPCLGPHTMFFTNPKGKLGIHSENQ